MDIPSSGIFGLLRFLLKAIADFFGKLFFYKAYKISTRYHDHREALGIRPNELVEGIEYKVIWKPYYLGEKLISPMIWVKAKHGKNFSKLVLSVTASNNKIRYQDHITLTDISETPIQTALPSIPFRNLKFKSNIVFTPYDDIQISVMELYDQSGTKIDLYYGLNKRITPFDKLEVAMGLEKGDIEKWGEIFNLEFIEMEIKEEKIRLIGPMFANSYQIYLLRKWIFHFNWVVKVIFWSKNLVTARHITLQFNKYLENHEEYKKWKENRHKLELTNIERHKR